MPWSCCCLIFDCSKWSLVAACSWTPSCSCWTWKLSLLCWMTRITAEIGQTTSSSLQTFQVSYGLILSHTLKRTGWCSWPHRAPYSELLDLPISDAKTSYWRGSDFASPPCTSQTGWLVPDQSSFEPSLPRSVLLLSSLFTDRLSVCQKELSSDAPV